MILPARLAILAALLCMVLAAPALAQRPYTSPRLRDKPKGGFGAQVTATPTARATPTATPEATATAGPHATPRHNRAKLPTTGADAVSLALAGLALVGFGLALRYRVALADARLHR